MSLYLLKGACRILAGAEVTHSPVAHLLLKGVAPGLWITPAGALLEAKNLRISGTFLGEEPKILKNPYFSGGGEGVHLK